MNSWGGFGFCDDGPPPLYGFGKYKLYEINSPRSYLILDYRDNFYRHYEQNDDFVKKIILLK